MTFHIIQCHKCDVTLRHGDLFCWNCGEAVIEAAPKVYYRTFCIKCEMQLSSGDKFCRLCGGKAIKRAATKAESAIIRLREPVML